MISKEEIEHLKDLARVEFGAKETEKLAKDLDEILEYIDQLKKADVSNAPEMTHALEGVKNIVRKDENNKYNSEDLIGAFPEKENSYLKVKAIL
ncbi:hypothetical protein A3B05_00885 [Candidatus Giovannonibacteria bacterium RIFCSPLOWO2_01_FULL_43_160]|uniref:Aspartyl/glutamyl-tRNA(Asn/Gln) amidotransferase subunit C n=2 Tax=Candidatus Giovannoniibacteriota TaxID=1752738 RepID=A0A0G1IXG6_9BACT|nr:MAG: Aspartyl/glutamyl-tRNA(Asn/Gln) amidotransferase subunit C [Candidatus Giovannonibacteria bacterium GW2011_GWB1_43_13]KKS99685.1 MAG: Aspartyl/glutamyl-tRNA(Asn/Gln) amidotransferase subunit C [Candidatus Giovannonibacteria bacterium GW2011_GWA1_43_15]KKT20781.1 MAG: Aspartyl/glutamyl-tRNA(Asn/Gln) amidotransferase subunit C [Candidatus Giovannonibacteria bacterium GW2011_GWC2_43_8]KKT63770.1 MAG: Aspartyl/glutamyl-tRNA(Asn/Gln) amidotransferase subunit C [Candidatus Giovannonibacteria b